MDSTDGIVVPKRPLARKYLEPIIYLAERMAAIDGQKASSERNLIEQLAATAGMTNYRNDRWYKEMSDTKAVSILDIDSAKLGALVTMALILKADNKREAQEQEYFTRVRNQLKSPPIMIPVGFEEHKALTFKYFEGSHHA